MQNTALRAKFLPGERSLWEGMPAQGLLLTSRDTFLIPFSLFWLGFVLFWLWTVASSGAPIFFYIWGIAFLVIGLFFLVGRFAFDAWLRSRTAYGVTDQRVLILRSGPFSNFSSIALDQLPEVNLLGDGKARGHIRFGPSASALMGGRSMSAWIPAMDPVPQFLGIAAPSKTFDLITKASREARAKLNAGER